MDTTPDSLLQCLRRQPTDGAWARFVTLFAPILYRWATQFGAQPDDAEDLVQAVLVDVCEMMPSFEYDPAKSFRALLQTMVRSRWLNHCRRQGRGALLTADLDCLADDKDEEDGDDYRREFVGRAARLIQGDFDPKTWQAVMDSVTTDESIKAVAQRHGMTPNALSLARRRVLGRLRAEVDGMLS